MTYILNYLNWQIRTVIAKLIFFLFPVFPVWFQYAHTRVLFFFWASFKQVFLVWWRSWRSENKLVVNFWMIRIHEFKLIDNIQFYSKLRPPKLRPVFGENAKICHPKIFQTKAGFLMRSHFWKKISAFLNFDLKILGLS